MTLFSSLLSDHIKSKKIRTFPLSQYCDVDRSNMYKIISGKRTPNSEDAVHKIADFMRLTPAERREMLEAYEITTTGFENYYRRKNVQDFIKDFITKAEEVPDISPYFSAILGHSHVDNKHSISGRAKLTHTLFAIFAAEAQKEKGYIKLIFQPDSDAFMESLASISQNKSHLKIDHIICLNNTDDITADKRDYNLCCLQKIIPMYYKCLCDYSPFSYYDNIDSHSSNFNLLSSLMVTSEYAITFSPQLKYGILFTCNQTLEQFHSIFDKLKADTAPIVHKVDSIFTQFDYLNGLEVGQKPGICFQKEPCFTPMIPLFFPEKYLVKNLPDRNALISYLKQFIEQKIEIYKSSLTHFIFTEAGVKNFLATGRIFELPDELYNPIEYPDRILIIRNLISVCRTHRYQMLRPNAPISSSNLCIYVTKNNGYLLFSTANGALVYLNLEEPSLLLAFHDYLSSLSNDLFYSTEETIALLKELLKN